MKINLTSLLKWQEELTYVRQSGIIVDGYNQNSLTSGTINGFIVPNIATDSFTETSVGFVSKSDKLLITADSLEINDILGDYKVIEEVEVLDLCGLNLYGLKKVV